MFVRLFAVNLSRSVEQYDVSPAHTSSEDKYSAAALLSADAVICAKIGDRLSLHHVITAQSEPGGQMGGFQSDFIFDRVPSSTHEPRFLFLPTICV